MLRSANAGTVACHSVVIPSREVEVCAQQRDVVVVGLPLRIAVVQQKLQFGGKAGHRLAVNAAFGKRLPDAADVGAVRSEWRLVQRYRQDLHRGARAMAPRVTPWYRYARVVERAEKPESLASESLVERPGFLAGEVR